MRRPHHRSSLPASVHLVIAAVLVAAIVIAVSAGHGGSGGGRRSAETPTSPAGAVERRTLMRALDATRAVASGRVAVTTTLTGLGVPDPPPGGRLIVARYSVAFDRRARRVGVEVDMSGAADPPGTGVSNAAGLVAAGDVVYARAGPLAAVVGHVPGDWVRADRAAFGTRGASSDAARLVLDPLGPFEVVGDTSAAARVVGHDVIRGSPATHLATSADLGAGVTPIEVWIDADGLIRRLEIRLPTHAAGRPGAVVTTIDLYEIGGAVSIPVPAAAGGGR
ncbi:MAG TPA: hypothetical protein VKD21_09020 [Acidimicrobiales bacterium]|nr:hypothetical protein [Acidimicrobiales bacterium]